MRRSLLAPSSGTPRRALRRLLPVAALGAAAVLAGCQTQSPIQTDVAYVAADGVPVDLGDVKVRNLVVVSGGKDKPGVLSASVSNSGDSGQRITFAVPNAQPVEVSVPAHSHEQLSAEQQVQLPSVPAAAGGVVTLTVTSAGAPAAVVTAPVVPASGYYAGLAPKAEPATSPTTTAP